MKKIFITTIILSLSLFNVAHALKDPTRPPNISALTSQSDDDTYQQALIISGVIRTAHGYIAIINQQRYTIGDEVNGLKIIAITNDHVTFADGDNTFKMPIQHNNMTGIQISKSANN